ncbi:hypothetical protein VCR26J2_710004 [Vibrio coralliirubri]|nr:hypothetical protein VCR26J2_710004 [Vibrio coralliirubri]
MARYEKRHSNLLLISSFTRIPHPLLSLSHPVYSLPASALSLFASRLPVTRICS